MKKIIPNSDDVFQSQYYYYYNQFSATGFFTTTNQVCLYQIADLFCKKDYSIEEHTQFCDELTIVYEGSGTIYSNNVPRKINKGQLHLCFKGDHHLIKSDPAEPLKFFCIGYEVFESSPLYPIFTAIKRECQINNKFIFTDAFKIHDKCKEIISELYFDCKSEPSQMLFELLINEIILLMYKNVFGIERKYGYEFSKNQTILYNIKDYLDNNICSPTALKDMPRKLNYSYSHLSHIFFKAVNENLGTYFYRKRMDYAKQLLQEKKSVTEVANKLGYASIHAFSKAYTNYFKQNPSQTEQNSNSNFDSTPPRSILTKLRNYAFKLLLTIKCGFKECKKLLTFTPPFTDFDLLALTG